MSRPVVVQWWWIRYRLRKHLLRHTNKSVLFTSTGRHVLQRHFLWPLCWLNPREARLRAERSVQHGGLF